MSKPLGGVVALTNTPVDLKTGLAGQIPDDHPSTVHSLILRASTLNTDDAVILTDSTIISMVLTPGDAMGFDLSSGNFVDLSNIFVAGTTQGDSLFVFGIQ